MMWTTREEAGLGGQPKVLLAGSGEAGAVHAAEIYLFGATVTSFVHRGEEQIFVSPLAFFNGAKAVRGGIPLVFPQFGQPLATMPQHGFARNQPWHLSVLSSDESSARAVFTLSDSEQTLAVWPHRFRLCYTVVLSEQALKCSLDINCLDEAPFNCQALLHTYLNIGDISSLSVCGFNGLSFADKVRGGETFEETDDQRTVDGEVDRVYIEGEAGRIPDVVVSFLNEGKRRGIMVKKGACLSSEGGMEQLATDVVFWNPWEEKSAALADMSDDGYRHFVCVEPGVVHGWTQVSKDVTLVLHQELIPTTP